MRVHPLTWFRFAPVRHLCPTVLFLPTVLLGISLLTRFLQRRATTQQTRVKRIP